MEAGVLVWLLLPLTRGWEVVWSVPSLRCKDNASLPLDKYGIRANPGRAFRGPVSALFYEANLGLYPRVDAQGNIVNGGIPQKVDLDAHLKAVAETIERTIPDPAFDGVGIIDWESWRPVWGSNWGAQRVYQRLSLAEARERWPSATPRQLKVKARRRFNRAAKRLMTETILVARSLRPWGRWGFYGFPMCHHQDDVHSQCSRTLQKFNKRWKWLFRVSSALFPSTYLSNTAVKQKWSPMRKHLFIQTVMVAGLEWAAAARSPPLPVFPFTKLGYDLYDDAGLPYSKSDLCSSVKQAGDLGCAGVVIWGSSFSARNPAACTRYRDYILDLLGPFAIIIQDQKQRCGSARCSGSGECVMEAPYPVLCSTLSPFKDYHCDCRPPFSGPRCQHHPADFHHTNRLP